jgi:hypothetical protein
MIDKFNEIVDKFLDDIEVISDEIIPIGNNDKIELDNIENSINKLRRRLLKFD